MAGLPNDAWRSRLLSRVDFCGSSPRASTRCAAMRRRALVLAIALSTSAFVFTPVELAQGRPHHHHTLQGKCHSLHNVRRCPSIGTKPGHGLHLPIKTHGGKGAANPYAGGGCTAWAWANRPDLPGNLGNARYWGANAARAGFPVDNTPQVGSIAVYQPGSYGAYYPFGHVAVVTAVQGNRVQISEASYPYDTIIYRGRWTGIVGVQFIHQKGYSPPTPPPTTPPTTPPGGSQTPTPKPPPTPTPPPPAFYVHHVYGTCADGACGLHERSGPGYSNYPSIRALYYGNEVEIVCQTHGQLVTPNHGYASTVWDKLTDGGYVTDVYIDTTGTGGNFSPPIPQC